jgi:hypothetical protein
MHVIWRSCIDTGRFWSKAIGLYFADKIQCRGEISSTLMMDRLLNILGSPLGSIENIELARFRELWQIVGWMEATYIPPIDFHVYDISIPRCYPSGKSLLCQSLK